MQCTEKEIQEKKRLAQLKLQRKRSANELNGKSNDGSSPLKARSFSEQDSVTYTYNNAIEKSSFKSDSRSLSAVVSSNFSASPYQKAQKRSLNQAVVQVQNPVTCNFCLINENRFAVEMSAFLAPCVDIFKAIPSRSYNSKTRVWDFDLQHYDVLYHKLMQLQPELIVIGLPQFVIKVVKIPKPDYSKIDLQRIDSELRLALMPFQEEGVCFGIDKKGRCLIADDMGLGKTFQALAIADYYRSDWPVLIVTTSSMKNTWEETIHRYLPSVSLMHTQYMVSGKDYIGDARILIVSHDMMSRAVSTLQERRFGVLIIDESHTFKNFKAKCTKAATSLSSIAKRVILLSGTPAMSRPSELYTQLALIDKSFFGSFFEYSKRYCSGQTTTYGWDASGKSNLQELEVILNKRFMIRRTKDEVLRCLPEKMRQVVYLDVKLNQLAEEDRKKMNMLAVDYNNTKKSTEKHSALLKYFSETSKIKIPSVCSFVVDLLEENKKFIVFAHHHVMLDAIGKVLSQKKKDFIRIDGNTTSEQRKYLVDKFQYNDNCVCAVLSITAANAGITLTSAKIVIFAELHWNPSILCQAESRAHRIGQSSEVVVKYLLAKDTADCYIWPLLQKKQQTLKEVGLFKDSFQDVAEVAQELTNKENFSKGLDFHVPNRNSIMNYLTPVKEDANKKENINNDGRNSGPNSKQDISVEMKLLDDDYDDVLRNVSLLDDDYDDILGNVDIDV